MARQQAASLFDTRQNCCLNRQQLATCWQFTQVIRPAGAREDSAGYIVYPDSDSDDGSTRFGMANSMDL